MSAADYLPTAAEPEALSLKWLLKEEHTDPMRLWHLTRRQLGADWQWSLEKLRRAAARADRAWVGFEVHAQHGTNLVILRKGGRNEGIIIWPGAPANVRGKRDGLRGRAHPNGGMFWDLTKRGNIPVFMRTRVLKMAGHRDDQRGRTMPLIRRYSGIGTLIERERVKGGMEKPDLTTFTMQVSDRGGVPQDYARIA